MISGLLAMVVLLGRKISAVFSLTNRWRRCHVRENRAKFYLHGSHRILTTTRSGCASLSRKMMPGSSPPPCSLPITRAAMRSFWRKGPRKQFQRERW